MLTTKMKSSIIWDAAEWIPWASIGHEPRSKERRETTLSVWTLGKGDWSKCASQTFKNTDSGEIFNPYYASHITLNNTTSVIVLFPLITFLEDLLMLRGTLPSFYLSEPTLNDSLCSPPAPDSFCPRKFFQLCGLTKKSPQEVKNVFEILDHDGSGFIEEEELKWVKHPVHELQTFICCARDAKDSSQDEMSTWKRITFLVRCCSEGCACPSFVDLTSQGWTDERLDIVFSGCAARQRSDWASVLASHVRPQGCCYLELVSLCVAGFSSRGFPLGRAFWQTRRRRSSSALLMTIVTAGLERTVSGSAPFSYILCKTCLCVFVWLEKNTMLR